jgi:hypothetical protein
MQTGVSETGGGTESRNCSKMSLCQLRIKKSLQFNLLIEHRKVASTIVRPGFCWPVTIQLYQNIVRIVKIDGFAYTMVSNLRNFVASNVLQMRDYALDRRDQCVSIRIQKCHVV